MSKQDAQNITILIRLLEQTDFYIRYNCIHFLTTLLQNRGRELQQAVMSSPVGVSRLIDLLDDSREVIRNGMSFVILMCLPTSAFFR